MIDQHLPRYSNPQDIVEFVDKLAAFERGDIGPEEFRAFRLLRGVYGQRQEAKQMLRVKLPMGLAGPSQLEALADVAQQYSRGFGHVTTRQNLQFHYMKMSDAEAAMIRLADAGLTTREACGNSVRNVTACELAEVCADAPFDVTPYAEGIVRLFLGHPLSSSLPRKFKIAFSGCAHDCAKGAIHDLGFIATVQDGVPGFRVLAAGGLSSTPQNALVLHDFVPAGELGRVGEAIVRLFHALGNRENKHRARLKYVLRKLKEDGFRAKYAEFRNAIDHEAALELTLPNERPQNLMTPVLSERRLPTYLAWKSSNVIKQRNADHSAVYVRLELGDITADQLRALRGIVTRFGDGTLRFTIDQNIVIPWVDSRSLPALHAELEATNLARTGIHTARDITSCPGADTCNLAVTTSRQLATAIRERLELSDTEGLSALTNTVIKVSGCPNSCGQHHVADLGFHGGARTIGKETYPIYQLHLGGGVDQRGARFGRQVVKILARRVPEATVRLLRLFESARVEHETTQTFFERVDPKVVLQALGEILSDPPTPEDRLDIGETVGFLIHSGEGECAA